MDLLDAAAASVASVAHVTLRSLVTLVAPARASPRAAPRPASTSTSRPPQRRQASGKPGRLAPAPHARHTPPPGRPRAPAPRPPPACPAAHELEGELERRRHHLAQVPDLQLDRRDAPRRRRAASRSRPPTRRSRARAPPQQILGSGSPTSMVHHPAAAERGLDAAPCRGGSVRTSPISAACSQPGRGAQRRERARRPPRARRRRRACPRWPRTSGRCPRISAAPATAGCTGTSASRTSIATLRGAGELVEHRGHAAAGGVAQAAQRRRRRRRAARRPPATASACRTRCRRVELELAAGEHDRRAVLADRARDEDAVARAAAPSGDRSRARVDAPEPGRADVHRVGVAALDDLRVAGDDLRPRRRARPRRSPRPRRAARRRSRPSSSTSESVSASGRAPGDGEVVDRAVDRQLADRAAGEADRLDDEGVGGQREPRAVDVDRARVGQRRRAPRSRTRARAGPRSAPGSPCRRRRGPS